MLERYCGRRHNRWRDAIFQARTTSPNCAAHWKLPVGADDGLYALYVRIPPVRATTTGAIYTIQHAGESDTVVVDQDVFPNNFYSPDGWLYIGKYNFSGNGAEYIELTNRTQDEPPLFPICSSVRMRYVLSSRATSLPPR